MSEERYERRAWIGAGGMAVVHEAWDSDLERLVAIKEPRPDTLGSDPSFRERFLAEARKLALVHHPHVVQIYDVDAQHDPPRMIMELADGGSLRDHAQAGSTPPVEALAILRQLLAGLGAIHAVDLVHRDLKPENILLFGEVYKIADFGIAKLSSERTQRYVTPKYAAPEIQSGSASSPRADIYSLGLIIYELVTGAERFAALIAEAWHAAGRVWDGSPGAPASTDFPWTAWHLASQLTLPPLDEQAEVSPSVAAMVARMIAKDPQARYADGRAVLRALALVGSPAGDAETETVPEPPTLHAAEAPVDGRSDAPAEASAQPRREQPRREQARKGRGAEAGWPDPGPAATDRLPEPPASEAGASAMAAGASVAPPQVASPGSRLIPPAISRSRSTLFGLALGASMAAIGLLAFVGLAGREESANAPVEPAETRQASLRREALARARRGEHELAVGLIARALDEEPKDADLLRAGVRSELELANYGRAERLLDRLAAVAAVGEPAVDYYRGMLLLARTPNRASVAVPYLERAAGRAEIPADGYFYLGFARMQSGDRDGASDAFERFLDRDDGSEALAKRARRYLAARRTPSAREAVSAYARPLRLTGFQRPDLRLSDLRGDVVVLHLWATWCAPCKEELPSLVRFYRRDYPSLAARGLRVVTVSSDFALADLVGFVQRELSSGLPDELPVYWDPDSELNLHLGLGSALPQTVVLDRRGRRLRQVTGAVDWDSDRLRQQLESYL